jgi:hypothetical protein
MSADDGYKDGGRPEISARCLQEILGWPPSRPNRWAEALGGAVPNVYQRRFRQGGRS